MAANISTALADAIAAARTGRRAEARALLTEVVQTDTHNEQAWLWLSGVLDDPEEQRICLENVLTVNPHNPHARRGLAQLAGATATPPSSAAPPPPAPKPAGGLRRRLEQQAESSVAADEPLPTGPLPPVDNPCPTCGAPTQQRDRRCPRCDRSLMEREPAAQHGSCSLTWLGVLWMFCGLLSILGVIASAVLLALLPRMVSSGSLTRAGVALFQPWLITLGALYGIAMATLYIAIAMGLWRYRFWAYIASLVTVAVEAAGRIGLILFVASNPARFLGWFGITMTAQQLAARAEPIRTYTTAEIGRAVVVAAVFIVLAAVNHRMFVGRLVRISGSVPARTVTDHYNAALRCRGKGMWYLAAREMEAANGFGTADAERRHILGLCYAQVGDFGRSIRELRAALAMGPGGDQLHNDLVTVEKAARAAGHRYAV
jgi:hypothetical protein